MFAGVLRREARPATRADLDAMVAGLPDRSRGGGETWFSGCIGLSPPIAVDRSRGLALTGELLIANAAALRTELGLAPGGSPRGDGGLLLAAYEVLGERLPERLEGEFAFALWDGRRRRLLCARDALGTRPLYYHLGTRTFAFASDGAAVLALPEIPRQLNERALAGFLNATFDDATATGYRNVSSLAAGEMVVVDETAAKLRTFWSPDPVTELRCRNDAEYEEAFRQAITEAVTARITGSAVGVSLSGGLDSSTIACIAGQSDRVRVHAYNARFADEPASDERRWVEAVLRRCGAAERTCDALASTPLTDWAGASWKGTTPACNPQLSICRVTLEAAARDGVSVMLHGYGGDQVVSHGAVYLAELVGSGHLIRAAAEARATGRRHGVPAWRVLRAYSVDPFVSDRARRVLRRARGRGRLPARPSGLLRPAVVTALDLDGRKTPRARNARESHVAAVSSPVQAHVLAASHRIDAVIGVQRRYPLLDRRLVELCLSLPGDQKLRDGWTRSIMRRALADVLPPEVRLRPGKANLGPAFKQALGGTDRAALTAVAARPGALAEWVDPAQLRAMWQRCQAGTGHDSDWFAMWRLAVTSRWLAHHGFADAPPA